MTDDAQQGARATAIGSAVPFPALELANRVGSLEAAGDPFGYYEELGRLARADIVAQLPHDWTFDGKRVLDFGCGAGRTLRHFLAEAQEAEIWGCDIDGESINWLAEHLCPPLHVFPNEPEPPLDQPSASFDLVWSLSVFTHLTESWSRWLVELHRILRPGGLLFLTFIGRGLSEQITGEPHSDEMIGMNVTKCGQSWDLGGPMVAHSPWWIEEHWGRGFDVLALVPDGFASTSSVGQGSVLLRKRDEAIDVQRLERHRPGDDREAPALQHNVAQLARESEALRAELAGAATALRQFAAGRDALERQATDLRARLAVIENSRSWTLTRPLREAAERIRRCAPRRHS
jgi:SAM-dependent methyltransferase